MGSLIDILWNFDVTLLSAELRIDLNSDLTPYLAFLARFNRNALEFTRSDPFLPFRRPGDVGAGAA